jgi:hypothetical protein
MLLFISSKLEPFCYSSINERDRCMSMKCNSLTVESV